VQKVVSKLIWLLAAMAWLAGALSLPAISADDPCPICGKRYGTTVYGVTRVGREDKVFVCGNCAKLETTCYICNIPVLYKFTKLADGRLLCEDDTKRAVLTHDDAEKLFDDVKRDTQSILARVGSLPHHNIRLTLEAKARLDKSGSNLISAHDDRLLMGLTRSTGTGAGQMQHSIFLLHGLTRERMMVVSAHEYAHAWLFENIHRKLNQDTVEGFCDWIAYKLITQGNYPNETKTLLASDYSKGQLQAFLAAEQQHNFYRVIQWVKSGVDPEIEMEKLERVLVLREEQGAPTEEPLAFTLPTPTRAGRTNLVLKGLSGSKTRRFALINEGTFGVNEQGKIRLGDSNVVIRCLEIRNDAAVVQVTGEAAPRTLTLDTEP
jgi:hypothetical protein